MARASPWCSLALRSAGRDNVSAATRGERLRMPHAASAPRAAPAQADGVAVYLQTLRDLIEGDPVVQADVVPQRSAPRPMPRRRRRTG